MSETTPAKRPTPVKSSTGPTPSPDNAESTRAAGIPAPGEPGPGLGALLALDPLSPVAAVIPLVVVITALSTWIPALWALGITVILLVATDLRRGPLLAAACLALAVIVGGLLAVSAPIERVGASPVVLDSLGMTLQHNQVVAGTRLGGKLGASLSLFLLTGLLARPGELPRAMVHHLRMPYRIAYAGMAAISFRERFASDYRVIQEAHALRGTRTSLPLLRPLVRRWTAVPALMAGAVRHAERVSMSMDARGFGAHRTRTERSLPQWRVRDTLLVLACWTLAAAIVLRFGSNGLVLHDI